MYSKKEIQENFVFEKYKDTPFQCSGQFKENITNFKKIDTTKVYSKIINYQIKKYGTALTSISINTLLRKRNNIKEVKNEK